MWYCGQQRLRSACAYVQSEQSHCSSLEYSMSVKLLTKHLLEVLSLKGGCTCSSESTLVKMPHCCKSHVTAQFILTASDLLTHCGPVEVSIKFDIVYLGCFIVYIEGS